jgi:hypothetical protein
VPAVSEVVPTKSAPRAEAIAPVVVEPARPVLAMALAVVEPAGSVLATDDISPAAIEPTGSVPTAGDLALTAAALAAFATDDIAPAAIEPASGGTSRSTPATAARFSSSPMVE